MFVLFFYCNNGVDSAIIDTYPEREIRPVSALNAAVHHSQRSNAAQNSQRSKWSKKKKKDLITDTVLLIHQPSPEEDDDAAMMTVPLMTKSKTYSTTFA